MTGEDALLADTAEDLFEDAPCGYLSTRLDGTIVRVNRTFEAWTGLRREDLLGSRRFQELLSPGGQIYHETHYAPLLQMQGEVREIAVEIVRADGSRLPALINSVLRTDAEGRPRIVRTTVFDATDRRRYEEELVRARRREQRIAQQLQRSLLSGELPTAPGLDLAVAYRAAGHGIEVGGDWYDAFWVEEGRTIALAVGDVVGRGIEAAATMGQLRSALRVLAPMRRGPGRLLEALDDYVHRHRLGWMTTVVYAELDLVEGTLRFACAGHLPPLVAVAGSAPGFVWEGRSAPLAEAAGARPEATVELGAGGAALLYTDGLVERRERTLDEGLDRLREETGGQVDAPATDLAGRIVRSMHDAEHDDDVCLLVARLAGP